MNKTLLTFMLPLALGAMTCTSSAVARSQAYRVGNQWCQDVRVDDDRSGYRRDDAHDNRVAGTVLGAVVGGVIGHQVGGGNGRRLTTVGGAVAGGAIGNHLAGKHNRRSHYERQCWDDRR